jgi:hypothetical protein
MSVEGNVALVIPEPTGAELIRALRTAQAEYDISYLWIHGTRGAIGVVVSASEFRRLRAAAGEPLASPVVKDQPIEGQLSIDGEEPHAG